MGKSARNTRRDKHIESVDFSFQRERSEIMKADELLISAKELSWQKPISARRSRLNEWTGDKAPN